MTGYRREIRLCSERSSITWRLSAGQHWDTEIPFHPRQVAVATLQAEKHK